jgi:hypothetical protein
MSHFDITSGRRKYTAGNIDRRRYDRLVNLGWLTSSATNISDVEYLDLMARLGFRGTRTAIERFYPHPPH